MCCRPLGSLYASELLAGLRQKLARLADECRAQNRQLHGLANQLGEDNIFERV
jgi:hypothetical protein